METLKVATKRIVVYEPCKWFRNGIGEMRRILDLLGISYNNYDETHPEHDTDFAIAKYGLQEGIQLLKHIDNDDEEAWEVDIESLCISLDHANMTLHDLVDCFEWLLDKGEKNSDFVYVSFQ